MMMMMMMTVIEIEPREIDERTPNGGRSAKHRARRRDCFPLELFDALKTQRWESWPLASVGRPGIKQVNWNELERLAGREVAGPASQGGNANEIRRPPCPLP